MVFIITGAVESSRNTVGRLFAEALGWEFVEAENLRPPGPDARKRSSVPDDVDPTMRMETLSAAINCWIYEWQDVVVSCPMLAERDRSRLCNNTPLVRIVCLKTAHDTSLSALLDRHAPFISTELPASELARLEPVENVLTIDSSQRVEEIISEMVSALILVRRSPYAKTG